MKRLLAAISFAALTVSAGAADMATLTVTVEGVSAKGGDLRVGLFDAKTFPVRGSKAINGAVVTAKEGKMDVMLQGILPGEYGVKVLDDENANGVMDLRMGMFPAEPYGFSNDAKPHMGPPKWDDAKIVLKPGANAITIHLK